MAVPCMPLFVTPAFAIAAPPHVVFDMYSHKLPARAKKERGDSQLLYDQTRSWFYRLPISPLPSLAPFLMLPPTPPNTRERGSSEAPLGGTFSIGAAKQACFFQHMLALPAFTHSAHSPSTLTDLVVCWWCSPFPPPVCNIITLAGFGGGKLGW